MTRVAGLCAALALAVVTSSTPVQAQLGGLRGRIRDAAVDKATGNAPAQPAAAPAQAPDMPHVDLLLDAAGVDKLVVAIRAEMADHDAVAKELAALEPRPDYDTCLGQAYNSPEGQRLQARQMELVQQQGTLTDAASLQRFGEEYEAFGVEQKAYFRKECGPSRDEQTALEYELQGRPEKVGAGALGLDPEGYGYAVAKERVKPFCAIANQFREGEEARFPGDGTEIYWVYYPAEVTTLKARCQELLVLLEDVS